MKPPRLLIHLGLPKTATSSLQHNVFQKLHENGAINFFGKCIDYSYKTANLKVINYSGQFIRDAVEGKLPTEVAKARLKNELSNTKLNVFSDEGIMVAYPGIENLSLERKFENLEALLRGYDVKVIVTLREPVDYLYSLYVQLYPEFYSNIRELGTVQKYVASLLSDPSNILFESFFYFNWLPILKDKFDVLAFDYADLKAKKNSIFVEWGGLLDMPPDYFRLLLRNEVLNAKDKSGREVYKVRDLKYIENLARDYLYRQPFLFNLVKSVYNLLGIKKLFRYRFSSSTTHEFPTGTQYQALKALLLK